MTATIHDPLARLETVAPEIQSVFFRVELLRTRIAELEGPLLIAAIYQGQVDNVNLRNNLIPLSNLTLTTEAAEHAGFKNLLSILEASDEFAVAREIMEPILAQIAEDNRQIVERQAAESAALVAEQEATERAQAKALAAAEKDPAVMKARAALAAFAGPAPAPVDPAVAKARAIAAATPRLGVPLGAELASDVLDLDRELAADFH